jgi:predicted unusual protein kinase regulating ubiquinone biosynthesis (AarF/ABC1/UbiB family)
MLEEVEFTLEADNLEVFARFLEAEQLTDEATCPKVYRQASSKKVTTKTLAVLILEL